MRPIIYRIAYWPCPTSPAEDEKQRILDPGHPPHATQAELRQKIAILVGEADQGDADGSWTCQLADLLTVEGEAEMCEIVGFQWS